MAAVLVLLFGISSFQLRLGQQKTRDAQRKADLELVGRSLDAFLSDHKILPPANSDGKIVACGDLGDKACDWDSGPLLDAQGVIYITKLPIDPFSKRGWKYTYSASENRLNYKLCTSLEYHADSSVQCNWYVAN